MPTPAESIRAALETEAAAISPAIATAYENWDFAPPAASVPYQRLHVLFGNPRNPEMSASWEEVGFLQFMLCYPQGAGPSPAAARAGLIRNTFTRGRSLTRDGQTVLITETPEIMPGFNDGDRFCVPVRVPFRANVILV